ncbi:MAG: hypothetical protein CMP36_00485 [Rickettsiales bacterium]|nr:hypothetical protein [Rickettsiales bacterium]OUV83287.1 MAG: hypothetical protein CBC91_00865 [Rickettsiales bacterium TMED131]|tara:strand:- start:1156 stop:1833 length:678 start_codon:yes stop_codon:yes gene_type:complete
MNDFSYQKSLPLRLRPSFGRHDFIVGVSNNEAISWVDNFLTWKEDGLIIIGPGSSGKSHLANVCKHKYNCDILEANDINNEDINILNLNDLIIENIEKIKNFNFFLHIINILKEKRHKLILTSKYTIQDMEVKLEDLSSRLLAFPQAKILLPTDDVLRGIIIKLSKDKALPLNNGVINFIINHTERSYLAIHKLINELDQLALDKKKKITIPFVKLVCEKKSYYN